MKRKASNYQERVSKAVWLAGAYSMAGAVAVWYYEMGRLGWLVWLSTLAVLACMATLADAIFDSLSERLNIQSSWLDVRLSVLERSSRTESGQALWLRDAMPTDDLAHYYATFPEQKLDSTS